MGAHIEPFQALKALEAITVGSFTQFHTIHVHNINIKKVKLFSQNGAHLHNEHDYEKTVSLFLMKYDNNYLVCGNSLPTLLCGHPMYLRSSKHIRIIF